MAKFTDAVKATLKSWYQAGDQPTANQFAAWIDDIQDGIDEHDHSGAAGGDGLATLKNLTSIGIGTATPGDYTAGELVVVAGDEGGITIRSGITHMGRLNFADGTLGGAQYRGFIAYDHNNDKLWFGASAASCLVVQNIAGEARVGIGAVTPLTTLHVKVDDLGALTMPSGNALLLERNSTCFMNLVTDAASHCGLRFGDPADTDIGFIAYENNNDAMVFGTNAAEAARISSAGAVKVANLAGVGVRNVVAAADGTLSAP